MRPVLFQFGSLDIPAYLVMLCLGLCALIWVSTTMGASNSLPRQYMVLFIISLYGFGVIGARLFFVLEHLGLYANPLRAILSPYPGGFASYGAFIAASLAAILYARMLQLPLPKLADSSSVGLCLFGAFARLGCFFAGCCYGHPTSLSLGVLFPQGSKAAERWGFGVHVHPAQLYEAGCLIAIAMLLCLARKRYMFPGEQFLWLVSFYTAARFLNDFLRGDSLHIHGLTPAQWMSLPLLSISAGYLFVRQMAHSKARVEVPPCSSAREPLDSKE